MVAPDSASRLAALLFTDIVGSTAAKSRLGTVIYARMLRRHNELFETAAARFPGAEILKHTGDGYLALFRTASDAVQFALLFQHAMRAEPWAPESIVTRVGIHVGQIAAFDMTGRHDVIGLAADLAARVMSLAEGGQILLTRSAYEDARQFVTEHPPIDGPLPSMRWLRHGRYHFKGANDAIEVFEVGAENLAPLVAPPDGEKARRVSDPRSVQHIDEPASGTSDTGQRQVSAGDRETAVALGLGMHDASRHFAAGLLVIATALGVQALVAMTGPGAEFAHYAHGRLIRLLPGGDALAARGAIVDISALEIEAAPGSAIKTTPRDRLQALLLAVAEQEPAAIGIDIDFGPENGAHLDPRDPAFFDFCRSLGGKDPPAPLKKPVPVVLGVYRSRRLPADQWLGRAEWSGLAASLSLPNDTRWAQHAVWMDSAEKLPGIGSHLASKLPPAARGIPPWLAWAARDLHEVAFPSGLRTAEYLIDHGPLAALQAHHAIAAIDPAAVPAHRARLRGRVVILGDGTRGIAADLVNVPGTRDPVPGVFVHACSALTRAHAPLYHLTAGGRFALDAALAVLILAGVTLVRARIAGRASPTPHAPELPRLVLALAACAALFAGVAFVKLTRVVWLDFAVIAGATLFLPLAFRWVARFFARDIDRRAGGADRKI